MLKKLSELFETRKLISLIIVSTLCTMALQGKVSSTDMIVLVNVVVAFYFAFKNKSGGDGDV